MMNKYRQPIEAFLEHGNAQSWKGLQKSTRSQLIHSAQKKGLIDKIHAHLLEWMLEGTLTMADEAKVNELIEGMRKQLFDTLPAEKQEEAILEIPKIPPLDPLPSVISAPRILAPQEILNRFSALGVDLEKVINQWGHFYLDSGYANALKNPIYDIKLPEITEDLMEAFEDGFHKGRVDTLIIDDNRLSEGSTLKIFQPSTSQDSKKKFNETRQLSCPFLMNFLDGDIVDFSHSRRSLSNGEKRAIAKAYTYEQKEAQPIRLVAIHTGLYSQDPVKKYPFKDTADHLAHPYATLMSLGTWIRYLHYLKTSDPLLYRHFLTELGEPQNGGYRSYPEILLNSFTKDGHFITAKSHRRRKEYLVEASTSAHPFQLDKYTIPIITIQSDYTPIDDDAIDAIYEVEDEGIPF